MRKKNNKATIIIVALCAVVLLGIFAVAYISSTGKDSASSFLAKLFAQKPTEHIIDLAPDPTEKISASPTIQAAATQKPLSISVSKPEGTPAPTPHLTLPVPYDNLTAFDDEYTIAWISDTQHYSEGHPLIFFQMTQFIYEERDRLNLKYVVHTGDLVDDRNDALQWAHAVAAMDNLRDIPYGVLAGNHDVYMDSDGNPNYDNYSKHFGDERMKETSCFVSSYDDNAAHYDLLNVGATRYVFVYLSYGATDEMMKWANDVLTQFSSRVGVLCTHDYFKTDMSLSDNGETLFDDVVSKNPNIYLVLCGHRYNNGCAFSQFDDDGDGVYERIVYQMMSNYQAAGQEGGSGYMRFMQVDELRGVIRMYGYSPYTNDYTYYDDPATQEESYCADPAGEEFEIPIPWLLSPE